MKFAIGDRFVADVADFAPVTRNALLTDTNAKGQLSEAPSDEDTLTEEVALTLLAGLVTDLQVIQGEDDIGTVVRMAWPL